MGEGRKELFRGRPWIARFFVKISAYRAVIRVDHKSGGAVEDGTKVDRAAPLKRGCLDVEPADIFAFVGAWATTHQNRGESACFACAADPDEFKQDFLGIRVPVLADKSHESLPPHNCTVLIKSGLEVGV